jgi:predicted dehydrogenase
VQVGILGAGNISRTHAVAAQAIPGVRVAAVHGTNREKARALAREHEATAYDDLDSFLDSRPLDVVLIGSPSARHAEQAIAAVRRGLHVLVEKPLDVTVERVDALLAEADRAGVKVGVFFQDRLKPGIRRLKRLVDDGELGRPILAAGRVRWHRPPEYYADSKWRGVWSLDGGGAVMNQAIHTVDLMAWLLGKVVGVQARTATAFHAIEVEDTAVAIFEFASGALATLEASTAAFPGYPRRLELTGTEGTVLLEHDRIVAADLRTPRPDLVGADAGDANPSASSPLVSDASGHQAILEDFLQAVKTGGTPACDGREGRRSVELVQALYEAANTGAAVTPAVG